MLNILFSKTGLWAEDTDTRTRATAPRALQTRYRRDRSLSRFDFGGLDCFFKASKKVFSTAVFFITASKTFALS
jgi:hypothetical protein